jgi:O-antigen ligase
VSIGLGLLLLPVLFIGFQAMSREEAVEDRIANVNTIYSRAGAWLIQLQEGIRHPLLGIGFNNVRELLANEQVYVMGIKSLSHSHNCFLAFFVELGVFGLFSYLAIVASIIRMGLSRYRQGPRLQDRWVGICAIAILIGYLVPGLTSTMLYIPTMSHVYVYVCLGALAGIDGIIRSSPPVKPFMTTFGLKQNIP